MIKWNFHLKVMNNFQLSTNLTVCPFLPALTLIENTFFKLSTRHLKAQTSIKILWFSNVCIEHRFYNAIEQLINIRALGKRETFQNMNSPSNHDNVTIILITGLFGYICREEDIYRGRTISIGIIVYMFRCEYLKIF